MFANKMRKYVWGIHLASDLQIVGLEFFKDKWKIFKEKFKVKKKKWQMYIHLYKFLM